MIQVCDTKVGRPPKNSDNFVKPRKIAKKFANPEKYDLAKFQSQKNRTNIPVKILTCARPWNKFSGSGQFSEVKAHGISFGKAMRIS